MQMSVCREYTTYVNFGRKEVRAQNSLIQGEKNKIDGYLYKLGCTCDVYNVRLHLVCVKVFLENILFSAFLGKENVFMCLVAF